MSYRGTSNPSGRTGSATNRLGLGRTSATSSSQSKTSMTKTQATVIQRSSGTKIQTQSRLTATTIAKVPSQATGSRQGYGESSERIPPGTARIRIASRSNQDPKAGVQKTKVVVSGAGLKPSEKVLTQVCKGKCATITSADPLLQPFTEEVERGRPVPEGRYYLPLAGAPDKHLGPEEKKLRQKLQKFTPTALSNWKVETKDPFARKAGPLKQVHPDILSGTFRAAQGTYEPEYYNPLLEQRLDPSMPEQYWSIALREAMAYESGLYDDENPDDGQKEQYLVETTEIERQIVADLPGVGARSSPDRSELSGPRPYGLPPSGPESSERSVPSPSDSGARPCRSADARLGPSPGGLPPSGPESSERSVPSLSEPSRPCDDRSPQLTRPPCSKQHTSPLVQTELPSNLSPQIKPPTSQLQPRIQSPEFEHSVNVQMVPAPRMQGPVGEITAQKTMNMQRVLQASPQGTKVLTLLRGTNLESPTQAKQIDIMKKENLPPPTQYRQLRKPKCATKAAADPLLQPFTEEVERGRPVPEGRYYIPLVGAPDQHLGPEEKKLRQKLQKFTPTTLSNWKMEAKDPFARKAGPLKQVHPDIISGAFRAAQGTYEPEYYNPLLEQRLDPSMPEQYWSIGLTEAMAHESGLYDDESPDDGQKEQYLVETTEIERQVVADLPGVGARSSPDPTGLSGPRPCARSGPSPFGLPPSGPESNGHSDSRPSDSGARLCLAPCARSDPSLSGLSRPCDGRSQQLTRPPCSKHHTSPLVQTELASNLSPQIKPVAQTVPFNSIQPPTSQLQPRIQSPEIEHSVNVQMVPAPRMQGPVGEITAQKTINMQRVLQASPQGTKLLTLLRGTNLETPAQAKQIDIMKQENLPPPKQYRQLRKPKCATKAAADPLLEPFTEEVERGRPVPEGRYYLPLAGAPNQHLGPEEKKLRQKLQRFTPTTLSNWKVEAKDPFARKAGPLKQVHPDIISGAFRAAQGTYEPEYYNPLLEERLDPSMPEQNWSIGLREAMAHESGLYDDKNPDDGQKEQYLVETTEIERQVVADLPGVGARSSPDPSGLSGPRPCARSGPSPFGIPPSGPESSGRSDSSPSDSGARPCLAPCARSVPSLSEPSKPCDGRSPQQTRPPCSKQHSSPLGQTELPSNLSPQIKPLAQTVPFISIQAPTPQLQPRIQSPEFEHSVNVQMVPAPRMQGPEGEITAQKTMNMQRVLQASPQGTKVLTLLRGTNLESPTQAKQIDIMKQENLPPPTPSRPLSPQVAAPYKQISPQLQYVMPPKEECYSPQMRTSPGRYYPPPGTYDSPPPSPLLHRGQSPQRYTQPIYGMAAQQRYPSPRSPMYPSTRPTSPGSGQRPVTPQGGFPDYGQRPVSPQGGFPGYGQRPVSPQGGFPGYGQRPVTPQGGFPGYGQRPMTPQRGFPDYGQRPVTPQGGFPGYGQRPVSPQGFPLLQVPDGQRPFTPQREFPLPQVPDPRQRPASAQGGFPLLQVPDSGTEFVTPIKMSPTPSKMTSTVTPIRLEAAAPVPLNPADASLDVVRRLVDEERQDVVVSQELPPALTRKLNKLKKKPQSLRVLEETLDQSILIDEESETMKSDVIAEMMYSQETGVINPASSPRKTFEQLFPPLEDEKPIAVSPAAPAPLHDIVVPMGEATTDSVAVVNEDIKQISEAVAEGTEKIPQANAFAEAMKNDTEGQLTSQSPLREHKSREERPADVEDGVGEETPAKERDEDADYIPRGELEEQKAPWDINLGSLEDLVGGKMSMMSAWDNLPSDESVRATAGRLEYVLDVQKPFHHSCVQLRGSQMPAWFPGFYSVLPQVDGFVRLERSPSRAFASAWHVFAPYQSAEHSEVVIL